MERITIRGTSADLPLFLEEAELTQVSSLDPIGGLVSRFELDDINMRTLDVKDVGLLDGKIHSVRAESAIMRGVNVRSVEFTRCELSSLRWTGGKISRTRFDACKLLGARFDHVTLEHVVFTDCKMDYSTLAQIRASGPVIFIRCSLRETEFNGCNFARSLFDECDLALANFGPGGYTGFDLRGNDLSAVNGTHHLKRVVIDRAQLIQLAEALAAELDVTFGDDRNDPMSAE